MNSTATETLANAGVQSWHEAHQRYLELELQRVRLRVQRRVTWLRRRWKQDPLQPYQGLVISEAQADALLAGDDRGEEVSFHQDDPESAVLTDALAAIAHQLAAQKQSWPDAAPLPPIDVLATLFGLTAFERDILLLCVAPEIDPSFERLYAYVQDDVTRKYVTPHLALALFAEHATRESFAPDATLRRFRLVSLEPSALPAGAHMASPLRIDERVANYLCGSGELDRRIADLLEPIAAAPLAPKHELLARRLARHYEGHTSERMSPPLNLVGPTGGGKRAVAKALCDRLGVGAYQLDVKRLPAVRAERLDLLRLIEREMILSESAFYADAIGCDDAATLDTLSDLVQHFRRFFILASDDRWTTERALLVAATPKLDAAARRVMWRQAIAQHNLAGQVPDSEIDALVEHFEIGPGAIMQAAALARTRAQLDGEDGTSATAVDLWQACREIARRTLDDRAQRLTPGYTWNDIVLPEEVFRQLQDIGAQVAHRFQVYESWGFGRRLTRGRGITALFAGASGTGKTMAAEILAQELKLDLYRIDLAGVVNKYIGETEKNLRKVFDAAEQSGAILFFDEADALFGKRTEVKDSHDRYANIEVNYLLQRMEDYRGLAILATNRKAALDRAFLRRLRFLIDFPSPDAGDRKRIWQKVFPPAAAVEALDFNALARLDVPGGNIKSLALNAAFLAAAEGRPIGMPHVMRAARREYAKIDKLITPADFGHYDDKVAP
jgi:SpoVK/Ycf46/Vps4 family AAA+-type ATPase